jgi:hypothetical protein
MKNIIIVVCIMLSVQSCVTQTPSLHRQLLTYVNDYRYQICPENSESDSLFFLVLFYSDKEKNCVMINANDMEVPDVVSAPSKDGSQKGSNLYRGYAEIGNNFLFFYCHDSELNFAEKFLEKFNLKQDVEDNASLAKYHTCEANIDAPSWNFCCVNDSLIRIHR